MSIKDFLQKNILLFVMSGLDHLSAAMSPSEEGHGLVSGQFHFLLHLALPHQGCFSENLLRSISFQYSQTT